MSGAVSFVLGLLGLGAAGGVSVGQSISENKRVSQLPGAKVWNADGETNRMYERVRKEWMSLHGGGINCLGKWPSEYPTGRYQHSQHRNWFKAHLEAKGIPYDDEILDEVSHVNGDKVRIDMMYSAGKKRRGWF